MESVTPRPPQFVYQIKLNPANPNPHRQLWAETENLPKGANVRVIVGNVEPLAVGHYPWFREDLHFQFVLGSIPLLKKWQSLTEYLISVNSQNRGKK